MCLLPFFYNNRTLTFRFRGHSCSSAYGAHLFSPSVSNSQGPLAFGFAPPLAFGFGFGFGATQPPTSTQPLLSPSVSSSQGPRPRLRLRSYPATYVYPAPTLTFGFEFPRHPALAFGFGFVPPRLRLRELDPTSFFLPFSYSYNNTTAVFFKSSTGCGIPVLQSPVVGLSLLRTYKRL